MPRYAALLRGVMPMNAKMPELKKAFEAAGFTNVVTVLGSGNVVFDAGKASNEALQRKAEAAMQETLGRMFLTIIRPINDLEALLADDPYPKFRLPPTWKRDVTFLREAPTTKLKLPMEFDGSRILAQRGNVVFSAHLPNNPKGAVFMTTIEKTFGKNVTTRTWETVGKIVRK